MLLQFENLNIRNATVYDANLLSFWWNNGAIMAHAGFPNGTGETPKMIADSLKQDTDDTHRRLIIELDEIPIGEMSYSNVGNDTAEIGVDICDFAKQEQGYGRILLSMLIQSLFQDLGYQKIILDTNVNNKRAQHVYETLGFKKVRVRENAWENPLGELQSFIDYELSPKDFISFLK